MQLEGAMTGLAKLVGGTRRILFEGGVGCVLARWFDGGRNIKVSWTESHPEYDT